MITRCSKTLWAKLSQNICFACIFRNKFLPQNKVVLKPSQGSKEKVSNGKAGKCKHISVYFVYLFVYFCVPCLFVYFCVGTTDTALLLVTVLEKMFSESDNNPDSVTNIQECLLKQSLTRFLKLEYRRKIGSAETVMEIWEAIVPAITLLSNEDLQDFIRLLDLWPNDKRIIELRDKMSNFDSSDREDSDYTFNEKFLTSMSERGFKSANNGESELANIKTLLPMVPYTICTTAYCPVDKKGFVTGVS